MSRGAIVGGTSCLIAVNCRRTSALGSRSQELRGSGVWRVASLLLYLPEPDVQSREAGFSRGLGASRNRWKTFTNKLSLLFSE